MVQNGAGMGAVPFLSHPTRPVRDRNGARPYPVHYWLLLTGPNLSNPIPVPPCAARYRHIFSRTHCVPFLTIPLRSPIVRVPYRSRLDSLNSVPYGPARPPVPSMLTLSGPNVTMPNPGPILSRRFYDLYCQCASVTKLASPMPVDYGQGPIPVPPCPGSIWQTETRHCLSHGHVFHVHM
jgi:hypothetical protein